MIRQPICVLLAHVDHGKTSILDRIRGSSVAAKEAGGITQAISAYTIPLKNIKNICGNLLDNIHLTIPGILFIDSPGHEAFTTLRKRGGNISDIAILVVDINEGLKPQTIEAIEILKNYKTPFVVAANKIDAVSGWRSDPENRIIQNINDQGSNVITNIENKLYTIVGKLSEYGFNSERFDRVDDYTKQIAIIPISAKTGEGFAELLMVISGLAQKFLEKKLDIDVCEPAKGTILEVTEEKGIGKSLDVIIYDGCLKQNDVLLIGNIGDPIESKAKCLFNFGDGKLTPVNEVEASVVLKISGPNLEHVIPGMPIRVANENYEQIKEELMEEVEEAVIEIDNEGVVVKADTLGSLEALVRLLKEKNIKIKSAGIGDINKKDLAEASAEQEYLNRLILGFNVKQIEKDDNVKVITSNIIYRVIEQAEEWLTNESRNVEARELSSIVKPFKFTILRNHTFRKSSPAIVGVEVLGGTVRANTPITKDGKKLGLLKAIQDGDDNLKELAEGKQAAISITNVTVGRQINEQDNLYSEISEADFRKLKKLKKHLNAKEVEILKEYADMKRVENPTWGI
nr:translation initiation factor IF-2 [Nanoarchaeum sp.]